MEKTFFGVQLNFGKLSKSFGNLTQISEHVASKMVIFMKYFMLVEQVKSGYWVAYLTHFREMNLPMLGDSHGIKKNHVSREVEIWKKGKPLFSPAQELSGGWEISFKSSAERIGVRAVFVFATMQ